MITFNQINKAFNNIATAHKQINTYGIGDIWEIATSGTVQYPLMWAKPENGTLEDNVYVSSWTLIFMDIVDNGERNENDVLSDMELVALDVVALLKDPDYDFDFDYNGATIERFTERFTDKVAGVLLRINIRVPFTADRCQVPQSGLTITGSAGSGGVVVSCADAVAVLKNTLSTTLSSTSIASGASSDITAPDATAIVKNSASTTLSTTAIPSNVSTVITVSDGTYTLLNSSGATVQSGSVVSAAANSINVPNSPVIILNSSGTVIGNGSVASVTGGAVTASNITFYNSLPIEYNYPQPTGAAVGERAGDDYNQYLDVWQPYFATTRVGRRPQLSDFTTLIDNNVYGNTSRFTDLSGGQTYSDNYVIDHYTGLGWYRVVTGTVLWNNAIDACFSSVQVGYGNWYLPNRNQMQSIMNNNVTGTLNYSPFNITSSVSIKSLFTSTTSKGDSATAYRLYYYHTTPRYNGSIWAEAKTTVDYYIMVRKHF